MRKTLYYIFDPLCGWCYGAHTVVADIAENPDVDLQLMPSGMFSGAGARPMGPEFAAYAWANDQRINNMTDQPFSEAYRTNVLGAEGQMFDSSMATLALAAVSRKLTSVITSVGSTSWPSICQPGQPGM